MKKKPSKKMKPLDFALDSEGALVPLSLQILMQTGYLGGGKGAGKTSALKRLFEAAFRAGAQVGVIAPLGRWWSVRVPKNGRSGFRLKDICIFGGKRGDIPINAESGRVVARAVVQRRLNFVLDVESMRKKDRTHFLADFLEELQELKKNEDNSAAFVLFIDEVQTVAAQKTRGDEAERLRELIADLARECRNYRMGLWTSAQRSANVDKDLLGLVDALIVMKTMHHIDRAVFKAWVDEKGSDDDDDYAWLKKLRRLEKGQGYLYVPGENIFQRISVKLPDTYDATKTAVIGEKIAKVGRLSKLDVKKLGDELTGLVLQASENDPQELKARISRLESALILVQKDRDAARKTLQERTPKIVTPKPTLRFEKRLAKQGKVGGGVALKIECLIEKLAGAGAEFMAAAQQLRPREHPLNVAARGFLNAGPHSLEARGAARQVEKAKKFGERYSMTPAAKNALFTSIRGTPSKQLDAPRDLGVPGEGELRVLAAVAQYGQGATREQVTLISGYKLSTRNAYLNRLAGRQFVIENGGVFTATPAGVQQLGDRFEALPTGAALREYWLEKLPEGEGKIFAVLVEERGHAISREAIGERSGYKLSTRNAYIARLITRGVAVESAAGVAAHAGLFEESTS